MTSIYRYIAMLVLPLIILWGAVMPVQANPARAFVHQFVDIKGHWGAGDMEKMVKLGILSGFPAGLNSKGEQKYYASPEKAITRAEFAALLAGSLGLQSTGKQLPFRDMGQIPDWARGSVAALYERGLAVGSSNPDGTVSFRPGANINRAEIAAMLTRALGSRPEIPVVSPFADVRQGYIFYNDILTAYRAGLVGGREPGRFVPVGTAKRVEVMSMLVRFLEKDSAAPPTDSQLVSLVQGFYNDLEKALNGGSKAVLQSRLTGEAEYGLPRGGVSLLESKPISGRVSLSFPQGEPVVEVKSSRLATVRNTARVTVSGTGKAYTVTEKCYLQKTNSGWKIYAVEMVSVKV